MHHARVLWQSKSTLMTIGVREEFLVKTIGMKMKGTIRNLSMGTEYDA